MMQLQMRILLSYENGNSVGIDNAIFMWRAATNYFPAIIGLGGFITYLVFFVHARKKKKPIFKEK
jgi:uncharacterized membrane protein YbhN (UPF0104 family)